MTKRTGTPQEAATDDIRSRLLDLAADQFASEGYAPVSVRDLASTLGLTTGAIYSNFRSKGDLLAEVLERRVREDMERSRTDMPLPQFVHQSFLQLTERATMRALLVEAAAAARTDADLRDHLNPVLGDLLNRWIADYRDWQKVRHVDRRIDMDALVRSLWSIELGVGVLEAFGETRIKSSRLATFVSTYLSALETTDGPRKSLLNWAQKGKRTVRKDSAKSVQGSVTPIGALRDSPKAVATQSRLIDAAIELFASRGYRAVTVRDLARATSVTTGSIYGNFANKAVLLVEVIEARIDQDLEQLPTDLVESGSPADLVEYNLLSFAGRAKLRALILEGAAAARSDAEVRQRLQRLQDRHLSAWAGGLEDRLAHNGNPSTDMRTAVTAVWSAELGLGLMEALGLPTPSSKALAQTFKSMFTDAGLSTSVGASPPNPQKRVAR